MEAVKMVVGAVVLLGALALVGYVIYAAVSSVAADRRRKRRPPVAKRELTEDDIILRKM
ncbi:hypothetical protein [Georgenia sp. AZ-5]|uniref:hypothetical protein n=1 Tax=Georgenia sp. AZ-5 TaxID=3367526 RepID=UPI003754F3D2